MKHAKRMVTFFFMTLVISMMISCTAQQVKEDDQNDRGDFVVLAADNPQQGQTTPNTDAPPKDEASTADVTTDTVVWADPSIKNTDGEVTLSYSGIQLTDENHLILNVLNMNQQEMVKPLGQIAWDVKKKFAILPLGLNRKALENDLTFKASNAGDISEDVTYPKQPEVKLTPPGNDDWVTLEVTGTLHRDKRLLVKYTDSSQEYTVKAICMSPDGDTYIVINGPYKVTKVVDNRR